MDPEAAARDILVAFFAAVEAGELGRDFTILQAIEKPLLSVIASLAQAQAAFDGHGGRRWLSAARGHCAEVRAIIRSARAIGYLAESGQGLARDLEALSEEIARRQAALSPAFARR